MDIRWGAYLFKSPNLAARSPLSGQTDVLMIAGRDSKAVLFWVGKNENSRHPEKKPESRGFGRGGRGRGERPALVMGKDLTKCMETETKCET